MQRPLIVFKGGHIEVRVATIKGYEIAEDGDSINLEQPNSSTRRARVGKGIANTLDTTCSLQCVVIGSNNGQQQMHPGCSSLWREMGEES